MNKHRVRIKEVVLWYRQKQAIRNKNVHVAMWIEKTLIDTEIRKSEILLNYYLNKIAA